MPVAILLFALLLISGCGGQSTGRILFASDRKGNLDIYAIDPSGENLTILTLEDSDDFAPPHGLLTTRDPLPLQ